MILRSLSEARHGVESCSAILACFASFSIRSESSGWENLKPCAAASPVIAAAAAASESIEQALMNRIPPRLDREPEKPPVSRERLAHRAREIQWNIRRREASASASICERQQAGRC